MQIDLRTVSITPLRQTYNHVADRLGGDKAASRYIEATMDVQANANFHYRPTWDPEHELFDATRTALKMKDWYALKDPRQLYYGSYTQARARRLGMCSRWRRPCWRTSPSATRSGGSCGGGWWRRWRDCSAIC